MSETRDRPDFRLIITTDSPDERIRRYDSRSSSGTSLLPRRSPEARPSKIDSRGLLPRYVKHCNLPRHPYSFGDLRPVDVAASRRTAASCRTCCDLCEPVDKRAKCP